MVKRNTKTIERTTEVIKPAVTAENISPMRERKMPGLIISSSLNELYP
jgi:hypothetical protein